MNGNLALEHRAQARFAPTCGALSNTRRVEPIKPRPFTPTPTAAGFGANDASRGDHGLLETLAASKVYREYEQAFTETTGMPMALRPAESWQLPLHGKRHEGRYCAFMSETSHACASCLQVQEKLSQGATEEPHTVVCPAGLCETAIPVRLGERLIGFLQTGQVFRKKPTQVQFERAVASVTKSGAQVDRERMREAYFATRVVPQKQQESATTLLKIFARYLSVLSNQVVVQRENAEPPLITKAKQYIQEHHGDDVRLGQVAKAVNASTFYFCKLFKKATGINFTDYLSRVRIEKSRNLLLNPNLRISEIAYEVGFQSLTHFNRMFKKLLGESPTGYRNQLMGATKV
jgi:AraC-like DNA-binding protein/ligand-binding sensor protein